MHLAGIWQCAKWLLSTDWSLYFYDPDGSLVFRGGSRGIFWKRMRPGAFRRMCTGADRRMSPGRSLTDEPWAQFDWWALGAIWTMSHGRNFTDEPSHICNYRAHWNGKFQRQSRDLSERFMQTLIFFCRSWLMGTTLLAAPSKSHAFSTNYHACIAMPTWCRCAPPILFWPGPPYNLLPSRV